MSSRPALAAQESLLQTKKRNADASKAEFTEFASGMNLQLEQQRKQERGFQGHW